MKLFLRIAELNIIILDFPFPAVSEQLRPFLHIFPEKEADLVYEVGTYETTPEVSGICILKKAQRQFYRSRNSYTFVYHYPCIEGEMCYYTIFHTETDTVQIFLPENYKNAFFSERLFLSLMVFDFIMIRFHRIMMHASVVVCHHQAVLFSGPSGIGKSTQAELWQRYKNADVLNGDRAILHFFEKRILVHGSPYAGSSEIYRKESAPLKAVVLLEQSLENELKLLSLQNAYKLLFPRFSIPMWDKEMLIECSKMIEQLMNQIPVYHLSCTAEEKTVDLLFDTLYSEKEAETQADRK